MIKVSKDKQGVITRDVLTKHWTDWVDYWAVDFNYESHKKISKVPKGAGVTVQGHLPGQAPPQRELDLPAAEFEERWTGSYVFENEWQSFRTRRNRDLEMTSAPHVRGAWPLHHRRESDRHPWQRHDDAHSSDRRVGRCSRMHRLDLSCS